MEKNISSFLPAVGRETTSKGPTPQVSRKRSTRFISRVAVRLSHETPLPLKDVIEELEKKVIVQVLSEVEGNQKDAAKILGMKYTTLNEKLKRYGIRIKRVSMILIGGLALYFSLSSLALANENLAKKARDSLERIRVTAGKPILLSGQFAPGKWQDSVGVKATKALPNLFCVLIKK